MATEETSSSMMKESPSVMPSERKVYMKPDNAELKKRLTPLQYHVTQKNGTERAFDNEYWDNRQTGIYTDIVSGEPLFSSTDKFKSGTGWPSFTRPLEAENIVEKTDRSLFMVRTEVRSHHGDSHLGHLFNDGPAPTGFVTALTARRSGSFLSRTWKRKVTANTGSFLSKPVTGDRL